MLHSRDIYIFETYEWWNWVGTTRLKDVMYNVCLVKLYFYKKHTGEHTINYM